METMRRRLGPLGLSLVAAALTATAFAGVSAAQNGDSGDDGERDRSPHGDVLRAPGPGGPHVFMERLSEEDRKAHEEFRQCMEDNGAPGPPELPEPGSEDEMPAPPEPPSEADREAVEKALEACEDKAPDGAGFALPAPGAPGCGPPPGIERKGEQQAAPESGSSSSTS
jgi:hypothetical protein